MFWEKHVCANHNYAFYDIFLALWESSLRYLNLKVEFFFFCLPIWKYNYGSKLSCWGYYIAHFSSHHEHVHICRNSSFIFFWRDLWPYLSQQIIFSSCGYASSRLIWSVQTKPSNTNWHPTKQWFPAISLPAKGPLYRFSLTTLSYPGGLQPNN